MAVPNLFSTATSCRLADLDANFAYLVTNPLVSRTYTGVGSSVMNDNQQTVSGLALDAGTIRGFITLNNAVNCLPRAIEAQTSIPSGNSFSQAFGIEIGLHSQVSGGGITTPTSIGIYCASSHTGWLPSGVRNDCGLFVGGEDGWLAPILCMDTDAATILFRVNSTGGILAHGQIVTNGLGADLCGLLDVSGAGAAQTYAGMRYDATKLGLRLEAWTNGTGFRNVILNPSGGNVIIGNSGTDDATGAQLQMTGFPRFLNTTVAPAGGNVNVAMKMGVAGTVGIYFGSGVPTITAGKGSIYMRTDGTTTNNRAYINTDGSTTWTAVTTVA